MSHRLIIENLTFETVEGKLLFSNLNLSLTGDEKVGLIGRNGTGKSTLLKIICSKLYPLSGKVITEGTIRYVPQLDLDKYKSSLKIYEYLGFDWWNILENVKEIFNSEINAELELKNLSGGELTKVNIAMAVNDKPDILLLDEPTNHLDFDSITKLISFVKNFNEIVIIVSHDIYFLNKTVEKIWELENMSINVYGGNYDSFKTIKHDEINAKARRYESAKKSLKKVKESILKENKRAQRGKVRGEKARLDNSMPKTLIGRYKDYAEKIQTKRSDLLEKTKEAALEKLSDNKHINPKKAYLDLKTNTRKGKLIDIKNQNLIINNINLIKDIEFEIAYGERIALNGTNGSGKTLFLNELTNPKSFDFNYYAPEMKIMYLSQKYEIINPEITLLDNVISVNKEIGYENARRLLGNFLFIKDDDINKKAKVLSGGETARLAFAIITAFPLDLLILDEPTNNLDIETIEIVQEAVNEFKGALIVVSHNKSFLEAINIQRYYVIEDGKLVVR